MQWDLYRSFSRGQTFKMQSRLNRMCKPHHHKTAFMNDLGCELKVKFDGFSRGWEQNIGNWLFTFFPFVERRISVIHQIVLSFVKMLTVQGFATLGIIRKHLVFTFMHWRRKWQPASVFLPRKSQGWLSLVGCRQWSHTESDTTEAT